MHDFHIEELPYPSGTPIEVEIRFIETGELAYTIEGVVSSIRGCITLKFSLYPDGRRKKASGVSCYPVERVRRSEGQR